MRAAKICYAETIYKCLWKMLEHRNGKNESYFRDGERTPTPRILGHHK